MEVLLLLVVCGCWSFLSWVFAAVADPDVDAGVFCSGVLLVFRAFSSLVDAVEA